MVKIVRVLNMVSISIKSVKEEIIELIIMYGKITGLRTMMGDYIDYVEEDAIDDKTNKIAF